MELHLYLDYKHEQIRFAAKYVAQQLAYAGVNVLLNGNDSAPLRPAENEIVIAGPQAWEDIFDPDAGRYNLSNEGYELVRSDRGGWVLSGQSNTGVMYGLMDLVEQIRMGGYESLQEKKHKPDISLRGVKFNLPFEPYGEGDVTTKNIDTCLSFDYWREYLDMLAVNRYNFLSLWTEHPFHMMFRLDKYPDTCPYDDIQLSEYQQLFHFIFRHAHARGIKVALITWNIRLPEFAAEGLGLPRTMGNSFPKPGGRAEVALEERNNVLNGARQTLPVVQDYIRECVRTLLLAYPEIDMIGTNCAEEMVGSMQTRQDWVEEAYLEAIRQSGRKIPFIMRTNCGSCAQAEEFLEKCPSATNFISWKYSYAHMHSAERPAFESIERVWENIRHPEKLNVLFTVRNDDYHTLRWSDEDFLREYLRGIAEKPYARGFYWGCDGYLYGLDFAHKPTGHKVWQYEFEKHWLQFAMFGRLSYDLETSDAFWRMEAVRHFGQHGEKLYESLHVASKALPPVNRLHWMDIDVRWHPETLLSMYGFRSVIDTYFTRAMPGSGTVTLRVFAKNEAEGLPSEGETPLCVIEKLKAIAAQLKKDLEELDGCRLVGEGACLREDLHCWLAWTEFFICRFTAALELARLEYTGDESHRALALAAAKEECIHWARLDEHWGHHYTGYMKARGKMVTGYGMYTEEVEHDQELVEAFGKVPMVASDYWTRANIDKA